MSILSATGQRAHRSLGALMVVITVFLSFPGAVRAQIPLPTLPPLLGGGTSAPTGTSATGVLLTVLGSTTTLLSTGDLSSPTDALGQELGPSTIGSLGSADALHAAAIGSGEYVTSEASLGNLILSVAGTQIAATSAYATAFATSAGGTSGWSEVTGLAVNGASLAPTGAVNETFALGAVTIVLNEVTQSAGAITVNALHITSLDGTVNLVLGSATALFPK